MQNYDEYLGAWVKGITSEYRYWDNYFKKNTGSESYNIRMSKNPEFQDAQIIDDSICNCLDVGSGPISILGTNHRGRSINLTAVDPLAPLYRKILKKYSIIPYCETKFALSECLSDFFAESKFDLVYMRNALDHSFHPPTAIMQMCYVLKNGGKLVLFHRINEAERRNYGGFHLWNLSAENNCFIIWNKSESYNIHEKLNDIASVTINYEKDGEFDAMKVIIQKKNNFDKPKTFTMDFMKNIFEYYLNFSLERENMKKQLSEK